MDTDHLPPQAVPDVLGPFELGRVARVFPRRTKATPIDALAFVGDPPMFLPAISRVLVSCAFTWDIPEAERLAKAWGHVAPVEVGGPAFGNPEGDFEPGKFLRPGYTITSRGCPNRCWFCSVWRRNPGGVRELPIRDGWILNDDNLLACSERHIRAVFAMLALQKHRPEFIGGLEAKRLADWHVDLIAAAKPASLYLAYDTPDDWEPLVNAARMLAEAGLTLPCRVSRCYVLIGYPKDTIPAAEVRLKDVLRAGLTPFAMLWRDSKNTVPPTEWRRFQRLWVRPCAIFGKGLTLAEHRAGQTTLFGAADGRP